ncbi:MAG: hypothetical protein KIT80_16060 [Chitinophagaceae bacterium]|nr:hypothetical protein [Chitinophagaceae bacterium]MCW5928431.1 hypothetical protein [Chitinophagaceae bacterium]
MQQRQKKIELLQDFLSGKITLSRAAEIAKDTFPRSEVVIYVPGEDKYRLRGSKEFVTKKEITKKVATASKVLFLPDNKRD